MHRRLQIALAILTLLLAAGYLAFRVATRESSSPSSLGDALDRFRAGERELPAALRGRAPVPGAYVYATRGFERSEVLGTRRHDYPARTTITYAPGGCGLRIRWDALATRWDAVEVCPRGGDGWRLAAQSEGHEFVGHEDRRTYRCTRASSYRPTELTPGASWSSRCAIAGTTTAESGEVVGLRTVTVGGRPVRTVLLRVTTLVTGDTLGTGTTWTWILPRTGLVARRVVRNASVTETVVGDVRYVERVTLALTSPEPRR